MKIAVIEWASDDAEAPAVYVGSENQVLRLSAVAMHQALANDETCDVLDEAGDPQDMDPPDLWTWHRIVREDCTSPWVTFYDLGGAPQGPVLAEPDKDMNLRLLYPEGGAL